MTDKDKDSIAFEWNELITRLRNAADRLDELLPKASDPKKRSKLKKQVFDLNKEAESLIQALDEL